MSCFNSADGTGLFTGVARYHALQGRVEICAAQARDLTQFWALLLRRMQWPVPPKAADASIVAAISAPDPRAVLRVLATESASIITLARMVHGADKAERKALRAEQVAEQAAITAASATTSADAPFNDSLDLLGV